MLKALFKKQFMEINAWLIQSKKNGKNRSRLGIAGLLLVYVILFGAMSSLFFLVSISLCRPLVTGGNGWIYLSIMGLMSIAIGVLGSIFSAYSTLYNAKDNECLLSMPIPPSYILLVRLFGIWMWSLIYEAVVFVPALIVYWIVLQSQWQLGAAVIFFDCLLFLLLSVLIVVLSCVLGWVVAKISTKVKKQSFVIVALSLVFAALYYLGYSKAYTFLQSILDNAQAVGEGIRGWAYPLYLSGKAGEGDVGAVLLFALFVLLLFFVVYGIMVRTFVKMVTTNRGVTKKAYREKTAKVWGKESALVWKEMKHFISSPLYMLNCGLGTLIMPAMGIVLLVKADLVELVLAQYPDQAPGFLLVLACTAICSMSAVNDISAPSVSLEGKNLWMVQSLPVSAWQVLRAKLKFHMMMTGIPAALCTICCVIILRPGVTGAVLMFVFPQLFVVLSGAFGLVINLKMPNLEWTNEVVPIKQSFGVMIVLLGGMGFSGILTVCYIVLNQVILPEVYLLFCMILTAILTGLVIAWLKKRGARIFEAL